jgi:hypothetical protein
MNLKATLLKVSERHFETDGWLLPYVRDASEECCLAKWRLRRRI